MSLFLTDVQPSPDDSRDRLVTSNSLTLPEHVDLLPDVSEVENQYQTGSCTANAAASILEIAYKRAGQLHDFSRLFIYWFSRQIGELKGDVGSYPRDVCKALNKHGTCLEQTWEFDVNQIDVEPSEQAKEEAKNYPVLEYARIQGDVVTQIKQSVASGIPVFTSIKVSEGFNSLGPDWKQHRWDPNVDPTGAHQVAIIGYNDESQRFLAQNSWGNRWGDGGFFGIPYDQIGTDYYDSSTAAYEYWVFSKLPVPFFAASGVETDPFNVIEEEAKKQESDNNKVVWGVVLITVLILLIQGVQFGWF